MPETCIKFRGHGARVMIENKKVPHFAVDINPEKKEVSCWIASEEGKTFSVEWLEHDVDYPSSCEVYLDGQSARRFARASYNAESKILWRCWVSKSSVAPFIFNKLVITDDDTYLDTPPSNSIGEIKLVIFRSTLLKRIGSKKSTTSNYLAPAQKVHERSKKAIAHQVNFGNEMPEPETSTYSWEDLETLVTFIFRYRPLEMLRANDIVPRNPDLELHKPPLGTPTISETSSRKEGNFKVKKEAESGPEIDDSDVSMREKALLAEVQRGLAELERIRKARGRDSNESERPKKKLKKEEKPFFLPGEIIDLTL